ncbi:MAG TPA: hypothetical protein VHD35_02830 [Chitinophagaceae bacterium]|nr:hypothetical protein [Chitinophagaceae bacterium]
MQLHNFDNLHQIDIPGGYSGTVEVSEGSLKLELPTAKASFRIKRYNFHLLTPDRKNIEFDLLRFPTGEWYYSEYLQLHPHLTISPELKIAAKNEISKMKI